MIEIKFIGRGGQGGKTAAYLAAEAAFQMGKDVQAFPEFGPEREGAPVFAYTRISDEPIQIHSGISNPDIVVVIDESLAEEIDVCEGLKKTGFLIINTPKLSPALKKRFSCCKVFVSDATGIAIKAFKKDIPNMPILGALSKVSGVFSLKQLEEAFKKDFSSKLKPEIIQANLKAMEQAFKEVVEA